MRNLGPHTTSIELLCRHWRLLFRITKNEFAARYKGSLLGLAWAVLYPLLFLSVYATIYTLIFQIKVQGLSTLEYTLYIFSGLIPLLCISETLLLGVSSLVGNKAILNNTVFPVDLISPKAVLLSQGIMIIGMPVLVIISLIFRLSSWPLILLPFLWFLQIIALCGLTWCLSLFNVVIRDLQYLVNLCLLLIVVSSPVAYTPDMIPERLSFLILLNPFAYFVTIYQKILILNQLPSTTEFLVVTLFSMGIFFAGSRLFSRGKKVIIDFI